MNYLFHLGHPAHFHLFRRVIFNLEAKGNECFILIKKKDILEELLMKSGLRYLNILPEGRSNSKFGIILSMIKTDFRLAIYAIKHRPAMMIGTSYAISHIGKLLCIPSVNVNEDDYNVVPFYSMMSYPMAKTILCPEVCNTGKWRNKTVQYSGYHELAYLHPRYFTPDKTIVNKYNTEDKPYFIIRFAQLTAHHDTGMKGINKELAIRIIELLLPWGKVYITSERNLEPEFEKYRMLINPLDIHHLIAFAQIYIGDSQTMAAEAGVLGTPFIRFNDFVDKIGYLKELEIKYQLGYGIKSDNSVKLLETIQMLLKMSNRQEVFELRRKNMLSEKIDVSLFFTWFIENYPSSHNILKSNPDYQLYFK